VGVQNRPKVDGGCPASGGKEGWGGEAATPPLKTSKKQGENERGDELKGGRGRKEEKKKEREEEEGRTGRSRQKKRGKP